MKAFQHKDASTVQDAARILELKGGKGAFIAGGTDLLGGLKDRIARDYPEIIVNLKTIPGLDFIEDKGGALHIGAMTRLSEVSRSPAVREKVPMLAEAAQSVASPQIRNVATLGGNLCQDVRCWYYRHPRALGGPILCRRKLGKGTCPAVAGDNRYHAIMGAKKCFAVCPSDTAVALTALEAKVHLSGPRETRSLPVSDLYSEKGLALRPGEILTEVEVPLSPPFTTQHFLKYSLREPIDFAVVSVAAALSLDSGGLVARVRIVLGGVAPAPLRAVKAEKGLLRRPVSFEAAEAAVSAALEGARPLSGNRYKLDLARALLKEALLGKKGLT